MIRKFSLAKGMFSTKISLAKGIRSKTGAAHPGQNFFRSTAPPRGYHMAIPIIFRTVFIENGKSYVKMKAQIAICQDPRIQTI